MPRTVDIRSKGELSAYLVELAQQGHVKDCENLRLDHWPSGDNSVVCTKKWASSVPASNVGINITGYTAASAYSWPRCPKECRYYKKSYDFEMTVTRDQYDDQEKDWRKASSKKEVPAPALPDTTVANDDMEIVRVGKAVTYPEPMTWRWLQDNVPLSVWGWLAAVALAIFLAGTQITRLKDVRELLHLEWKPEAPTISTTVPPVAAKSAAPSETTNK